MQAAQQRFNAATAEFTAIGQELFGWAKAVETESRREELAKPVQGPATEAGVQAQPNVAPSVPAKTIDVVPVPTDSQPSEVNKTAHMLELIQQRPGLTPGELWTASKIPNRGYVYSILGRLKERELVTERRGKYYFRVQVAKSAEMKQEGEAISVQ
jgi:hypothetical protein